MPNILTDLSPHTLSRAIQANLHAHFRSLSRSDRCEYSDDGVIARWHTAVRHPWFNGALASQPPGSDADRLVADTMAYFQQRSVGVFSWWLEPGLDSDAWGRLLSAHGFHYTSETPGMAVELAALRESPRPPTGLKVQPVRDLAELKTWAHTFGAGYGIDMETTDTYADLMAGLGVDLPLRHYLGWLDGRPVATSSLFLGAGVAGIYNVGTLAEARGRGIGAWLTLLPLLEARQMGYKVGILQSSQMGFSVYRRLGFQHLVDMGHFYWTAQG